MSRAWAIKLGSGGRCVPFCERRKVVGVGWRDVCAKFVREADREALRNHVRATCNWYKSEREIGMAVGQLFRFGRECSVGDYIVYYDPARKNVTIVRVASEPKFRDEPMDADDIWHYRDVEVMASIPIIEFDGVLKGRVLGPRMSFWELRPAERVEALALGRPVSRVEDPEFKAAYLQLGRLVSDRVAVLDSSGWEMLVADYFRAQGAQVDDGRVGGNQAIVDVEARFDLGELGHRLWRIQVKRYQDRQVDWPEVRAFVDAAQTDDDTDLCFVSVFGFTADAKTAAYDAGVRLLECEDFTRFAIGGKLRPELRVKLNIPEWTSK